MVRAVRYSTYGAAEVLEVREVAVPAPGPRDVRVDVVAAGVGGGEVAIRAGRLRRVLRQRLPAGSGVDFVGTVAETGTGVREHAVGDAVWGLVPHGAFGALAEQVVVPAHRVVPAPTAVDPVRAAALPAVGTTALRALTDVAPLRPGRRLLVRGAAGGVGSVAVQLGAAAGAHVTALVRGRDLEWIRGLGADDAVDHRGTTPAALAAAGPGFDVVLDLVGTGVLAWRRLLRPGGVLVALALDPARPLRTAAATVLGGVLPRRVRTFSNDPTPAQLTRLRELVDAGTVRPVVETVLPLSQVAQAHRLLEAGGVRGKIVLTPQER